MRFFFLFLFLRLFSLDSFQACATSFECYTASLQLLQQTCEQMVSLHQQVANLKSQITALTATLTQLTQPYTYLTHEFYIYSGNFDSSRNFAVPLPIPPTARKILVFGSIQSGDCLQGDWPTFVTMNTNAGKQPQKRMMNAHCYHQYAWSFNSDNIEFDIEGDNNFYIEFGKTMSVGVNIQLLAWK